MHSLTLVISSDSLGQIVDDVNNLLLGSEASPGKSFPNYEVTCSCFNSIARNDSFKKFDSSPEGIELSTHLKEARQKHDESAEDHLLQYRSKVVHQLEQAHPEYLKIDSNCDICLGTGFFQTSRDPRKHWDYWVIGGRWSGLLPDFVSTSDDINEQLRHNFAKVADIPETVPIAVVVTPEGYWYEGPYYISKESLKELVYEHEVRAYDQWKKKISELKEKYPNHYAVIIDCHD
jgi:hypothetical protein